MDAATFGAREFPHYLHCLWVSPIEAWLEEFCNQRGLSASPMVEIHPPSLQSDDLLNRGHLLQYHVSISGLMNDRLCRFTFNDNANLTNSTYINLKEREG